MEAVTHFFIIPEVTYSFLAILALLAVWQYHNNQVLAGRIYAIDFWDMSGIRMFLHVVTLDGHACEVCQVANGTVFLPSLATKTNFSTLPQPCAHTAGCRCLIVGLYGGWPEANHVLERLRKYGRRKALKLREQELLELFDGPWHRSVTAAGDQMTINMLEAMRLEGHAPEEAVVRYRYVIDHAKGARDLRLVAPAFVRLSEVLERLGHHEDAVALIERFEQRFPQSKRAFYFPSDEQRGGMAMRKYRLQSNLKRNKAWTHPAATVRTQSQS